jgi:exodeoxyribonuclease VII large subunit
VEFAEVQVSGPGAALAVIAALQSFDERADVEVIILARGGGDATQLLTFSDEELCRAIGTSRTPVVSAIGHEGDRPLCDEVADVRCGTPSIAAAAVVPSRAELEVAIDDLLRRALVSVEHRHATAAAKLDAVVPARALDAGLQVASSRLARATSRVALVHPARMVAPAATRLNGVHRQLEALAPARVLERGYAVVRTGAGEIVRSPDDVAVDDALTIDVAGGRLGARVQELS